MELIFNAESLQSPLTGIGLYTRHLVEELSQFDEVSKLGCFFHGRLIDARRCLELVDSVGHETTQRRDRRLSWLQAIASRTTFPYRAHMLRNRLLFRRETRHLGGGCVYHEPNYVLKPFQGPTVVTVHDLSVLHYPQFHPKSRVQHLTRFLDHSLRRATHVVTDSEFVRREVVEHFSLPLEKISAIHLGVSAAFRPRTEQQTASVLQRHGLRHGHYLLCVATHEPRKNLTRLIEAYAALPTHLRHDLPLVLVGSRGWHSGDLTAKLQARGKQGSVQSLGYVPRDDLPALFAGARVFAFPSIYEGFGLPVLEAMACGTPVVTSKDTSMVEITQGSALLIDPHSAESIRDGLLRLLEDNELATRLSSAALDRAAAFTWRRCAEAHLEVYQRALRDI